MLRPKLTGVFAHFYPHSSDVWAKRETMEVISLLSFICAAWSVFPVFSKHFYFSLSFYCYGVKNIDTLLTNLEICLWLLLWCVTWYPILIVLTIFFFYNCAYLQSFGCAMFITVKVLQVLRVFNPRVFCLGWVGGICCLCQVCSDNFHRKHQPL